MIIIVTGSRFWIGSQARMKVEEILDSLHELCYHLGQSLEVHHGDCPTGADATADRWARRRSGQGVTVQPFPALWDVFGKGAGPRRNMTMVDAGADMVIAFLRQDSAGTRNCVSLARTAKIPTHVVEWNLDWPEPQEVLDAKWKKIAHGT